jgi:hypothetical protein
MYIVTFSEPVFVQFSKVTGAHTIAFEPHKPYVTSASQFHWLLELNEVKGVIYRKSLLESRLTPFNVLASNNDKSKPLLFWTGTGGFGDQILSWPAAYVLHRLGYHVHVMVDPGNAVCWWGFEWVKSIFHLPVYLDTILLYGHHALFEVVTNLDEHLDQLHPVDAMLARVGLDPDQVDPELKVVRPCFTHGELARAQAAKGSKKLGIYQLAASKKTRALSPARSVQILTALADAFPDFNWLALFDGMLDPLYRLKVELCGRDNVKPAFFQNLRDLWALTSQAELVVAPDSMMAHVAGSMNIPCVGLWGTIDPSRRVKYYRNHIALWKKEKCHFCPCYHHGDTFPTFCPARESQECQVLASIDPDEVVSAAKVLLA